MLEPSSHLSSSRARAAAFLGLALSLVAPAASAQSVPPDTERARASIAQSHGLGAVDGQLVGGGRGYSILFEDGAVEVTPTLGESAPRDFPVRLTLASIRRGEAQLCGGGTSPATRADAVNRVRYARSDSITERYDVRAEGVELSFAFATRPTGRGDLVVRMRVDSELTAPVGDDLDELELTRPGTGDGVSIGAVTGIAADGRRAPGSMRFDGTHVELVLPDEFVENATYPLVLDPLIGGITSAGASFDDYDPDVAYDATNDSYLVVWEIRSSAANSDIWAQRLNGDGSRNGGIVFVVREPGLQSNPAVANVAVADQFAVVWQDDRFGSWDIEGRGVAAVDGSLTTPVTVAGTSADEVTPDAGGDATGPDDEALIVWKTLGGDLEAVQLELQPGQAPTVVGSVTSIDNAPQSANPAIAKSGGVGNRYLIVWESSSATDWFVRYTAVDRDLAILTPTGTISGNGLPISHPDVDGDGTRWMFVYELAETPMATAGDIWNAIAEYDLNGALLTQWLGPLELDPNVDETEPDVALAGEHYVVAWSEQQPAPTEYRIGVTNVSQTGQRCGLTYITGRRPTVLNAKPVVCAQLSGGGTRDQTMLCWEHGDLTNGNSLVMRERFASFGGGPVVSLTPGCPGGGTAATSGPFAIGNPSFKLTLSGADPTATTAVVGAGFRTAIQVPCGSCAFLTTLATATVPINAGAAEFTLPVPCDPTLIGGSLATQWWVVAPGLNACPLAPGLAASNILGLTIRD